MRVVLKEMQKILTIKNVLLLLVLTLVAVIFGLDTNEYTRYKYFENIYIRDYNADLYKELISRAGPTLSSDEAKVIDEIEAEQYEILDAKVGEFEELNEAGITSYKEFVKKAGFSGDIYEPENEEELKIQKLCRKYYIKIGFYDYSDKTAEAPDESVRAKDWLMRIEELRSNLPTDWDGEYSLIYPYAKSNCFDDLTLISIWITICCMFLILPYQVREKQSRIIDLKYTSKVGRSFYVKQWLAVTGSCMVVALINLFLLTVSFCMAGYTKFLSCPNSAYTSEYWVNISFGMHLFIYFLMIMIFTAVAGTIFFLLSETGSYGEVLAMGIPCGILLIVVDVLLLAELFTRTPEALPSIKFIEVWMLGGITLAVMSVLVMKVRKNRLMDIQE